LNYSAKQVKRSAVDVFRYTIDKIRREEEKFSEELKTSRLNICEGCSMLDRSNYTCMECGCYLKSKASWVDAKCPLGKWNCI
jgi:ribosomal protein L32